MEKLSFCVLLYWKNQISLGMIYYIHIDYLILSFYLVVNKINVNNRLKIKKWLLIIDVCFYLDW